MTIETPIQPTSSLSLPLAHLADLIAHTVTWREWLGVYTIDEALARVHLVSPDMAEPALVSGPLPADGDGVLEFEHDITEWPDKGVVEIYPSAGGIRETVRYLDRGDDYVAVGAAHRGIGDTKPTAGESDDVAMVTPRVRRPYIVVDDGDTLDFTMASTGRVDRFRQQGDLFLFIEGDIPDELWSSSRDSKIWFLNQAGNLRDELLNLATGYGRMIIRDVRKRMGPMWPDEAEVETEGRFMQLVFSVDYGAG